MEQGEKPAAATLHSLALRHLPVSIKSSPLSREFRAKGPPSTSKPSPPSPCPRPERVSIKGHRAFRLLPNLRSAETELLTSLAFIGYGFLIDLRASLFACFLLFLFFFFFFAFLRADEWRCAVVFERLYRSLAFLLSLDPSYNGSIKLWITKEENLS